MFITAQGHRWEKTAISDPDPETGKIRIKNNNSTTKEFIKVLKRLGLKRPGLAFYGLRHSFETVAGASKDQVTVDAIMGHAAESDDMAATYFIPSENEYYKAAYYDPTLNGGAGGYWLYPTKSNTTPINTLPDTGIVSVTLEDIGG